MAIPGIEPPTWAEKSVEERYEKELTTLRARLAAAEKVVEAARIALRFMERGTMSVGIQYEIGVQLKEALTAYQEHSDGR